MNKYVSGNVITTVATVTTATSPSVIDPVAFVCLHFSCSASIVFHTLISFLGRSMQTASSDNDGCFIGDRDGYACCLYVRFVYKNEQDVQSESYCCTNSNATTHPKTTINKKLHFILAHQLFAKS